MIFFLISNITKQGKTVRNIMTKNCDNKQISIIHISDLHYSASNDYNISIVIDALCNKISKIRQTSASPDFIVFSGDLVQSADDVNVYYSFYEKVIEKISLASGCDVDRFIFCPGNHDVNRADVEKNYDLYNGLSMRLTNRDSLNKELCTNQFSSLIRNKFKSYYEFIDLIDNKNRKEINCVSYIYKQPEYKLNFVSINSSTMSLGGFKKENDLGKLLIPERAIIESIRSLDTDNFNIIITHHPTDWLRDFCKTDFYDSIKDNFCIHLYGHMHTLNPASVTSLTSKTLNIQAGALYSGRSTYVGFSLIKIDEESKNIAVELYSYSDSRHEFHKAEQLIEGGVFYPTETSKNFWTQRAPINKQSIQSWIYEVLRPSLDSELNEGLGDKRLCDVFVAPITVYQDEYFNDGNEEEIKKAEDKEISFENICKSTENYIIYGKEEYGKTTLLKQICHQLMVDNNYTIPVLISFNEINSSRDRILRLIKAFMKEDCPYGSIRRLLNEGMLTILVDDVNLTDINIKYLQEFCMEFPKNKFIFCSTYKGNRGFSSIPNLDFSISMKPIFIKPLTRRGMRSLVGKWDQQRRFDQEVLLDKIINEIKKINIPVTAVNGTILLTIYESQSNFSAINKSVLVENFIEALLDKWSPDSALRKTFDFTNQTHLLGYIARWMCTTETYLPSKGKILEIILTYLNDLGLNHNASAILENFIKSKILHCRLDDTISFRYRAFFEYFLASEMQNDVEFRNWVLQEDRYLGFINEIQYYAGINRRDMDLIDVISKRFIVDEQDAIATPQWDPNLNSLTDYKLPNENTEADKILGEYERQVGAQPLTKEERDEILEADLPKDVENRQEVFRPKINSVFDKIYLGLLLYSAVLRDLELISGNEKEKHLENVLRGWGLLLMHSLILVPQIARHRKFKLDGVVYEVLAPLSFTETQVARLLYVGMPTSMATMLFNVVGTEKLQLQIAKPLETQKTDPEIINFFRISLLADLKIEKWWENFSVFSEKNKKSKYMLHILLWKMRELHMMGDVPDIGADRFKRIVSETISFFSGYRKKEDRNRMISNQIQKMNKEDYIRKIRINNELK